MYHPPPALTATLQALRGQSDMHVIAPALGNREFARVLAFAPSVHPIVGALGALAGKLPDILSPAERKSPVLSASIASLIGTNTGERILPTWATVAPDGWGASHATALIDAVRLNRCAPWAAAALIGPCDTSAALLQTAKDIADAVRRWGLTTPDNPTAWMDELTPVERDRLLAALRESPADAARCLPWLPRPLAASIADLLSDVQERWNALDAYAGASPVAHTRHAEALSTLIQRAEWVVLAALTRLAVASGMDAAWKAVIRLLSANPQDALNIVTAASWKNLHPAVQSTILSAADHNEVCATIAFARSACSHPYPPVITFDTTWAFFATVTPTVWTALPHTMQQTRISYLHFRSADLAVRSLGPDPAFLERVELSDSIIAAMRGHAAHEASMRRKLLPVAVSKLPADAIPAVIAALPTIDDPIALAQIVGKRQDIPPALREWIMSHSTARAATATTVLRVTARSLNDEIPNRCAALATAFTEWPPWEIMALIAVLPSDVRTTLFPNPDALTHVLAHPNRKSAFRKALNTLAALPPFVMLPALHALDAMAVTEYADSHREAGAALAQALRHSGDCFLAIVDTLADTYQENVLPARDDETRAHMHALAAVDPLVAHRLAHALRKGEAESAFDALMDVPFDALTNTWRLLPDAIQQFVIGDHEALLNAAAAPGCTKTLAQMLWSGEANNSLAPLALRMLIDNDPDRRTHGVVLLAQQPNLAATLLPLLRADVRMLLERDSRIALITADLPLDPKGTSVPYRRRRR